MSLGYEVSIIGQIELKKTDRIIPAETFEAWSKRIADYQERAAKAGHLGNAQNGELMLEWVGKIIGDLSANDLLAPLSFDNIEGVGRSRYAFLKERDAKILFVHVCLIEAAKIFAALGDISGLRHVLMQASGRDMNGMRYPIHGVQRRANEQCSPDIMVKDVALLRFHPASKVLQHVQFCAAEEFAQDQLLRSITKRKPENIALELRAIAAEMHFGTGMTPNPQKAERLVQLLEKGVEVDAKNEHYAEAMNGLLNQLLRKDQPSALVEIKIAQQRQAIRT